MAVFGSVSRVNFAVLVQKNSAIAGAIAGAAVALTGDAGGHSDKLVNFAITGAALSSAGSLLSGIF
jgi:hypothetical protein